MSKKAMQQVVMSAMLSGINQWSGTYWDCHKELRGSPIYNPRRHKFKRRLKR